MRGVLILLLALGCSSSADRPAVDASADSGAPADTPPTDVHMERAATPVITPPGGSYTPIGAEYPNCALVVEITSATPGAVIRYTIDGTLPDVTSPRYLAPFDFTRETVKAIATAPGYADSVVASNTYQITFPLDFTSAPVLKPAPGKYDAPLSVTMASETEDSVICYTVDGSSPSGSTLGCAPPSMRYTGPVAVTPTAAGVTLMAMASSRCRKSSAIVSGLYRLP